MNDQEIISKIVDSPTIEKIPTAEKGPEIIIKEADEFMAQKSQEALRENKSLGQSFLDNPEIAKKIKESNEEITKNDEKHHGILQMIREKISTKAGLIALSLSGLLGKGSSSESPESNLNQNQITANAEIAVADYLVPDRKLYFSEADRRTLVNNIIIRCNPKFAEAKALSDQIEKLKHNFNGKGGDVNMYQAALKSQEHALAQAMQNITPEDLRTAENELAQKEQLVDDTKNQIKTHIQSDAYLQKLAKELSLSLADAKIHQQARLQNLDNLQCRFLSLSGLEEFSGRKGTIGFYLSDGNVIYLPYDLADKILFKEVVNHEILHEVTRCAAGIPSTTKNILKDSYKGRSDNYFSTTPERLVRKQLLDDDMERLGIKKYEEKFTHKHFVKLMDAFWGGKLSRGSMEFIRDTGEEDTEKIINEVANAENYHKAAYPPDWYLDNDKA